MEALRNKGGRPLCAVTPEMLAAERALMDAGPYNISRRARALGMSLSTLRYHLRPAPSSNSQYRIQRKKKVDPHMGRMLRYLLMAGDHLERNLGIDTEAKREARAIWHRAKKSFMASRCALKLP